MLKRCCLCGGDQRCEPPDDKFWHIVAWKRWAHPPCFRSIMPSLRTTTQDEIIAMITEEEERNGWTHTRYEPKHG